MKVVYLNTTGSLGGAERCLLDVLSAAGGPRAEVILGEDGPLAEALASRGVPHEVMPLPSNVARLGDFGLSGRAGGLALAARGPAAAASTAAYVAKLRRRLRSARPDLVQTNGMKAHVLGAWAAPKGVPVLWHLHDYISTRAIMSRLLRLAARRPVAAVAVSRSVALDARRALGPRVPIRAIHNAVDLDEFSPGPGDGPALDASAGLPEAPGGTVRVGLVATFARWKGHEVFLEAAAKVGADRACRFYVVGGPIYRTGGSQWSLDELRERAGALGLGDRAGFVGHRAEPAGALRSLDVVVHASTRPEPFGRVIVEAMACARAVVAVADGGAAELFADGEDALGIPPGDSSALASAIDRLVIDARLRDRLGRAGRASAEARFDRRELAGPWLNVYESMVDGRGPMPGSNDLTPSALGPRPTENIWASP